MVIKTFKTLSRFELCLWLGSCALIIISFISAGEFDLWVLITSLVGATALIFMAKGEPLGQILTVLFSLFYGYVSFTFQYWGEMITYLGMTMPMAVWSTITWIKNPAENGKEVEIQKLTLKHIFLLTFFGVLVTAAFYY